MRQKLIELSEILKQKPEIKKRLERLEFGCWIDDNERDCIDNCEVYNWVIIDVYEQNGWKIYRQSNWFNVHQEDLSCCWKIIGREPQYSDILEYLGENWSIDYSLLYWAGYKNIFLSPWTLSEQSDETLDKIISLCKKNVPRN